MDSVDSVLQSVRIAPFREDFVKIAQPFMAGYAGQISHTSPVRDDRSFVPDGTCFVFLRDDPPLKRWAIFFSSRSEFHLLWLRLRRAVDSVDCVDFVMYCSQIRNPPRPP